MSPILSARVADVSLRWSSSEDDAACGDLVGRAAAAAAYTAQIPFALPFIADRAPLPVPPGWQRIVAVRGAQVIGLAQFDPQAAYLKYLFVDPAMQRCGIGRRLLDEVERQAGLPLRLTALSVNQDGLRFYLAAGYRITGGELELDWHGGAVVWLELKKSR